MQRERPVNSELEAWRPEIVVREMHETVPEAIRLLAHRDVFQRATQLVQVIREAETTEEGIVRPAGTPRIRALRPSVLELRMSEAARWKRWRAGKREPELVDCRPPQHVVQAVHDLGEWDHIRPLRGVVDCPVLRPDGSLLHERGYDARTALICEPNIRVQVPDEPTLEDAKQAVDVLMGDVLSDFPFAGPAHGATWLAALLTVLGRPAIAGPVPAFLYDANEQGTGKTLAAELVGLIALGRIPTSRPAPKDAAEWSKSLLAIAQASDSLVLFDNVKGKLESDALELAITGTTYGGRELGATNDLTLPWRAVVMLTANNATLSTDLVRRTLHIRLVSKTERPSERTAFRHPDLKGYVIENRAKLLGEALTLLRAYVVAGRPDMKLRPMGSFEAWTALVRNAMVWAGCPDPAETQQSLREVADTDRGSLENLLAAWRRRYGSQNVTTSQILTDAEHGSLPEDRELREAVLGYCDTRDSLPSSRKLGNALRHDRDRVAAGLLLQAGAKGNSGKEWRVCALNESDSVTLVTLFPVPHARDSEANTGNGRPHSHESHHSHRAATLGGARNNPELPGSPAEMP